MHRIFYQHPGPRLQSGDHILVDGEEARHALRVKRLSQGDSVEIIDGSGMLASGAILGSEKLGKRGGWSLNVQIDDVSQIDQTNPEIEVLSAVPKGPKLESLIEGLSQAGACSWGPMLSERAIVDPRDGKMMRLERVVEESAKQCGRAWLMHIAPRQTFADLLRTEGDLVVADETGKPYEPNGEAKITLAVGPEGGWTPQELSQLKEAGARVCRFGLHVLRVEMAAVTACAQILDHEQRHAQASGTQRSEDSR